MYKTHSRDKFNILCKKIICLLFTIGLSKSFVFAQEYKRLPFYDDKQVHYGLQFGIHQSRFKITHSNLFVTDTSIQSIIPHHTPGIAIGMVLNYKLDEKYLDFRLLPSIVIYDRKVTFDYVSNKDKIQQYNETYIDVPAVFKFKSERRKNHRVYFIGGATLGLRMNGTPDPDKVNRLMTQKNYFEITYGFGMDLYMSYFKFAPEIRFSHGITNYLYQNNSDYSKYIESLTPHRVTFVITFE